MQGETISMVARRIGSLEDKVGEMTDDLKSLSVTSKRDLERCATREDLRELREKYQKDFAALRQDSAKRIEGLDKRIDAVARENKDSISQVSRETRKSLTVYAKKSDLDDVKSELRTPEETKPTGLFVYDEANPLDGIIAHLARQYKDPIVKEGITVTTNSCDPSSDVSYILDPSAQYGFLSDKIKKTWITLDFRNRRVIPKSYTLRTNNEQVGGRHLRSWVLEVSNDGKNWHEVDRRKENDVLNSPNATANFTISQAPSGSFRYIRLRQIGKNHKKIGMNIVSNVTDQERKRVYIKAIEIFGTLCENEGDSKLRRVNTVTLIRPLSHEDGRRQSEKARTSESSDSDSTSDEVVRKLSDTEDTRILVARRIRRRMGWSFSDGVPIWKRHSMNMRIKKLCSASASLSSVFPSRGRGCRLESPLLGSFQTIRLVSDTAPPELVLSNRYWDFEYKTISVE